MGTCVKAARSPRATGRVQLLASKEKQLTATRKLTRSYSHFLSSPQSWPWPGALGHSPTPINITRGRNLSLQDELHPALTCCSHRDKASQAPSPAQSHRLQPPVPPQAPLQGSATTSSLTLCGPQGNRGRNKEKRDSKHSWLFKWPHETDALSTPICICISLSLIPKISF